MAAAAAARYSSPSGAVLILVLIIICAPCGAGARPVREEMGGGTRATAHTRASPALDVGRRWASGSAATAAVAHRVATVGGGAPTPPSGPSQNHN